MKVMCLIALLCLLVLACAPKVDVKQDYDPSTKFDNYKTFAWIPKSELPEESRPKTAEGQWVDSLFTSIIEEELYKNGFSKVSADPDLLISYWLGTKAPTGLEEGADYMTHLKTREVYNARGGLLVIDFVDAKVHEKIWSGWGESRLNVDPSREIAERNARNVVNQVLTNFPPK